MSDDRTSLVEAILRYGGRCHECADNDGICEGSGLPCEPDDARRAIRHVLNAAEYYQTHPHFLMPPPSPNNSEDHP